MKAGFTERLIERAHKDIGRISRSLAYALRRIALIKTFVSALSKHHGEDIKTCLSYEGQHMTRYITPMEARTCVRKKVPPFAHESFESFGIFADNG